MPRRSRNFSEGVLGLPKRRDFRLGVAVLCLGIAETSQKGSQVCLSVGTSV